MNVAKGKTAAPPNNKNQPQQKKAPEVKPVKKEWSAKDYVTPNVS